MRVAVTGGSGFIGLRLVKLLAAEGNTVLVIGRKATKVLGLKNVDFEPCDLSNYSTLGKIISRFQPNVGVHLAWNGIPDYGLDTSLLNLNMSVNAIEAMSSSESCRRIIVSGSCMEYGDKDGLCVERERCWPADYFGWAKLTTLEFLRFLAKKNCKEFGWLRFFYVYGPGQRKGSLIPTLFESLQSGRGLPILQHPENKNDFIYVDDVVELLMECLFTQQFQSGIYNVGSGRLTAVKTVAALSQAIYDQNRSKKVIDVEQPEYLKGGLLASTELCHSRFSWRPRTPLSTGIVNTIRALASD